MQTVSRLISYLTPRHYELSLNLQRVERTFDGVVTVYGTVQNENELRLHEKNLVITSAQVNGREVIFRSDKNDELVLEYSGTKDEDVAIVIGFSGTITDQMHGMYPCYYEHDGIKKELLATQFESHHAREVFPCIDEPEAKATYDVILTTEQNIVVLGNMPIASQQTEGDKLITTFQRSPIMSSYLLAWVAGEMHKISASTKSGVEVNVWATPAQPLDTLDFAVEIGVKVIEFYDEYFGVPYPLPKADHVALPDFSSGAMENWGLITYREVALLVDPKTASASQKHFVASIIAHELAHQWFGNLVTMKWWDDLWLNESFADFVEHIALDELHPEWETWLDFVLSRGIGALRRDATDGVQSVHIDVHHPDEISTLFDGAIVYGKGARLMKMLRSYVGDEAFRAGLTTYFTEFAYKNTVGTDLWKHLGASSGKDVAGFMDAWLRQPGYPVLEVSENGLRQEQFFIGDHQPSDRLWPILLGAEPVNNLPQIMNQRELAVPVTHAQRFNVNDNAHFITCYSSQHLQALLENVESFSTIDRLGLLNNQTLLVRSGKASSADLIAIVKHYTNESNDAVWDTVNMTLAELRKFVEHDEVAEAKLRMLSCQIAANEYQRLGFDEKPGETLADTKLRPTIVGMMLYGEDENAIAEARKRFAIENLSSLPFDMRSLIISTAVRHSGDNLLPKQLMRLYQSTPSADLREAIIAGITSTRDEAVAVDMLSRCKDPAVVRPQDVAHWFVYFIRNRYTREASWQWLQTNWAWIEHTFGGDKSYDEFPRYAAMGLMTDEQLKQYKDFFVPLREQPALTRSIDLGITEITARLDLIARDGESVRAALSNL